jgi:hypothetical protein
MFECPALQDSRGHDIMVGVKTCFKAPQGAAMILFMWQDAIMVLLGFLTHACEECTQ